MSHAPLFNIVINNMAQATSLATPSVEHLSFCPHGRVSLCLQNPYSRPSKRVQMLHTRSHLLTFESFNYAPESVFVETPQMQNLYSKNPQSFHHGWSPPFFFSTFE